MRYGLRKTVSAYRMEAYGGRFRRRGGAMIKKLIQLDLDLIRMIEAHAKKTNQFFSQAVEDLLMKGLDSCR